jgi:hypothetical protein
MKLVVVATITIDVDPSSKDAFDRPLVGMPTVPDGEVSGSVLECLLASKMGPECEQFEISSVEILKEEVE